MTFQDLITLTRRRFVAIAVCMLLGLASAIALLWVTPQSYTANSTAYVRVSVPESDGTSANANAYYNASQLATQKVKAFVPVFTSQTVAQAVIDQLGLKESPTELASALTASNATNSLTINVTATASTADQARQIADAVVAQAAVQVKALEGESSPVEVVMMAPADLSAVTVAPSTAKYLAAGVLAGLLLGYLLAFARDRFDTRIRTADDISERFEIPILGVIPNSSTVARTEDSSGDFRAEESLRKLRTNLRYANVDHEARILVVTSPMQGDGKSSIAAQLAKVSALAGQEVVLVDADLRRPTARKVFGIAEKLGLTQLLVGAASLDQVVRPTRIEGLSVLTAGDIPPNPSELLGSNRMAELMTYLSRDRIVIIDAPPVLPVTDAAVLSKFSDAVVMIVGSGKTTAEQLDHALASLDQAGGHVAGVVLNRASSSKLSKLKYGDSEYGYGYYRSEYAYEAAEKGAAGTGGARGTGARPFSGEIPIEGAIAGETAAPAPVTLAEGAPARPQADASPRERVRRRGSAAARGARRGTAGGAAPSAGPAPAAVPGRVSIMPVAAPPPPVETSAPASWDTIAVGQAQAPRSAGAPVASSGAARAAGTEPVSVDRRGKVRFPPLHASHEE